MSDIVFDNFGCGKKSDVALFGTEYEIENVKAHPNCGSPLNVYGLSVTEDHSLRNSGFEYKTKPLTLQKSIEAFKYLHENISLGKDDPFSERTSTHVHINMGDLTFDQVKNFILAYALVEPLFFNYCHPRRLNNIYCVPLSWTVLPKYYNNTVPKMHQCWSKYTAFNILPLTQFGTIEFRHLEGTNDLEKYTNWLLAINDLRNYAVQDNNILKELGKGEDFAVIAQKVVPTFAKNHSLLELKKLLYDNSLDVKLATGGIQ